MDHCINFSGLLLWLVSFLQILIYCDNRWRLLLKQFIRWIFTLDLCARLLCGLFQGCGEVGKKTQLCLRSFSFRWREVGDSSQGFSSDTLQGISSEWNGDTTSIGVISLFWNVLDKSASSVRISFRTNSAFQFCSAENCHRITSSYFFAVLKKYIIVFSSACIAKWRDNHLASCMALRDIRLWPDAWAIACKPCFLTEDLVNIV